MSTPTGAGECVYLGNLFVLSGEAWEGPVVATRKAIYLCMQRIQSRKGVAGKLFMKAVHAATKSAHDLPVLSAAKAFRGHPMFRDVLPELPPDCRVAIVRRDAVAELIKPRMSRLLEARVGGSDVSIEYPPFFKPQAPLAALDWPVVAGKGFGVPWYVWTLLGVGVVLILPLLFAATIGYNVSPDIKDVAVPMIFGGAGLGFVLMFVSLILLKVKRKIG